jgi:hypothetical protein
MTKKWYNFFISIDQPGQTGEQAAGPGESGKPASGRSASQTVAEIASALPKQTTFASPVSNPTSFDEIYRAAEIQAPAHGYTIMKIAEMLQSEHIRRLPADVKRSSILVALDAAGVNVREIIEDAVRRDRALDTYEHVQQKSVEELEAQKNKENQEIQSDMDRLIADHRARVQANNEAVAKEKERFKGWQLRKQQEEQKITDAVSYFVEENPITPGGAAAAPPSAPKAPKP